MPSVARDGLVWDDSGFDLVPVWDREPTLEAITKVCREKLGIEDAETCEISFYAEGAFNKLYMVRTTQRQLLMRVSLPVHPRNKTRGEVTTLRFLRDTTDVPVPEVIAFDDSADNEIGFEWILMQLMPGQSAYKRWRTLTMFQKVALVQHMAELQAQISRHQFSGIGTLVAGDDEHNREKVHVPGEMVSGMFFWGSHFDYDIARGPFRSSHDWLAAYLEIVVQDQTEAFEEAEHEDDEEQANFGLAVARRLISLLPKIFPSVQNPPERTVIWHEDLSLSNILVDEEGKITALIDWECVSALPRWVATKMPKFLEGGSREKEPKRESYGDESFRGSEATRAGEENELDNEGKNGLYWIHLMEYEQTQLRKFYHARMCQLEPDWEATAKESILKEDFFCAAIFCGSGFSQKRIAQWVDAVERGEFPRFMDIFQGGVNV